MLLYNWIDSDDDTIDTDALTGFWSHLHRRNLRMIALTWDVEQDGYRSFIGFSSAF